MAAGTFTVLRRAKTKMVNGTIDLDTHTIKAALVTSALSLTDDYAGTSTDARYADLGANEVANGSGYTTGGVTLSGVSLTRSGATVTFTSNPASWSSATFTAKWIVLYADNTNDDIIGYMELESGSTVSPSNGTLTVNPHASGWFTLA